MIVTGVTHQTGSVDIQQVVYDQVYPEIPAELTDRARTANFIRSTRAVQTFNMSSMDQIFYRVATLQLIDPTLANLPAAVKSQFIAEVLLKQNTNGGFGAWEKDSSSLTSTYQAVQVLEWLGQSYNKTLVQSYLDRLRNLVSDGFNSHLLDGDSDIYSTSLAITTYSLMGLTPVNVTNLVSKIQNAQNLDSTFVPANELGGFGMQTNSLKGIYWTSEIPVSSIAISALNLLSSSVVDSASAISFLQGMQLSTGGFVKSPSLVTSGLSYTAVALRALNLLGSAPVDAVKAETYVRSLEQTSGGFLLKDTSTSASLKGTYFGVLALKELGVTPMNVTATEDFVLNMPFLQDGFGATPGASPSLRETFDAVAAFSYMRRTFAKVSSITAYVDTYAQTDGGYGLTGSFMDSTSRAVAIYDILNLTLPTAASTISFVQGLQQTNGGFSKKVSNTTTFTVSTYRAVLTLSRLGAEPTDKAGAISYLQSLQNLDGGFGGFAGDTSDVSSTYRAVRALSILGAEPTDKAGAINFLRSSQVADGGFKRSVADVTRPNNISHVIYTYAGVRALKILGSAPTNVTGVYDFIVSLRNRDGGYGKHPSFTSDIAYTFTSLWVLANYHEISSFSLGIPQDWGVQRSQYDNTTVSLNGGYAPYIYNISDATGALDLSGVSSQSGEFVIDTSSLAVGTYTVNVLLTDVTGAQINTTRQLLISDITVSSTTTVSSSTTSTSTTSTTTSSTTSSTASDQVTTPTTSTPADTTSKASPGLLIVTAFVAVVPLAIVRRRK